MTFRVISCIFLYVTAAAVVGIDPDRALALARSAALAADDLRAVVSRLRVDLESHCTGVPSLLGSMAQWLWESSADVSRRAAAASDGGVFVSGGSAAVVNDALLSFVSAGNGLAVRLMVASLSKEQLVALARDILGQLEAAGLSESERDTYRRALLPLMAGLLDLATEPAVAVYVGGSAAKGRAGELRDLMDLVARLMLPPPDRQGSGWEAFFRGLVAGDWDRGYTTPGLESARVTGLLLGSLLPPADLRDAAAAVPKRDALGFILCAVSAYPVYGDLLRIVSKTLRTGFKLSKAASRVNDLARQADRLTVPIAPVPATASNVSRVRTVGGSTQRVTAGAPTARSQLGQPGVVELRSLSGGLRQGLRAVALGRVPGAAAVSSGEVAGLPKKAEGHFTRYDLADGSSVVTGRNAELYVSSDGGATWSAVR